MLEKTAQEVAAELLRIARDKVIDEYNTELLVRIGKHDEKLNAIEVDIKEIRGDVKNILETIALMRGGYKTLMVVGGIAATIGGLLTSALFYLRGH